MTSEKKKKNTIKKKTNYMTSGKDESIQIVYVYTVYVAISI
jgi:hypothetical protein